MAKMIRWRLHSAEYRFRNICICWYRKRRFRVCGRLRRSKKSVRSQKYSDKCRWGLGEFPLNFFWKWAPTGNLITFLSKVLASMSTLSTNNISTSFSYTYASFVISGVMVILVGLSFRERRMSGLGVLWVILAISTSLKGSSSEMAPLSLSWKTEGCCRKNNMDGLTLKDFTSWEIWLIWSSACMIYNGNWTEWSAVWSEITSTI